MGTVSPGGVWWADEDEAQALQCRTDEPAFALENRLLLQGRAVVHDRLLMPAALFKGLSEKALPGSRPALDLPVRRDVRR